MANQTVKEFDYRDVTVFVDKRDDGGYYVCYEGETKDGLASGSQDVGPFNTIEEAAQAGRDMRDAHDDIVTGKEIKLKQEFSGKKVMPGIGAATGRIDTITTSWKKTKKATLEDVDRMVKACKKRTGKLPLAIVQRKGENDSFDVESYADLLAYDKDGGIALAVMVWSHYFIECATADQL